MTLETSRFPSDWNKCLHFSRFYYIMHTTSNQHIKSAICFACMAIAIVVSLSERAYCDEKPIAPQVDLKVGDVAPDFETKTIDGRTWKLSNHRGRFVLIDFCATWCRPCLAEIPYLKSIWSDYKRGETIVVPNRGSDWSNAQGTATPPPGIAMLSLSLDKTIDPLKALVNKHQLTWPHVFLGDWEHDMAKQYGIRAIPAIMLIGPDGRIVARDLRTSEIHDAVEKHLPRKTKKDAAK